MLESIQIDIDLGFDTVEIKHMMIEWIFSAELVIRETPVPQPAPDQLFGPGIMLAQGARDTNKAAISYSQTILRPARHAGNNKFGTWIASCRTRLGPRPIPLAVYPSDSPRCRSGAAREQPLNVILQQARSLLRFSVDLFTSGAAFLTN